MRLVAGGSCARRGPCRSHLSDDPGRDVDVCALLQPEDLTDLVLQHGHGPEDEE